jgi:hypothetical protein
MLLRVVHGRLVSQGICDYLALIAARLTYDGQKARVLL